LVTNENEEEEDIDPEIHCLGDTSLSPHLTQFAYKESLISNQLNEMRKGEKTSSDLNRYNLKSKKKEAKPDIPERPPRDDKAGKYMADNNKERKEHSPPPVVKSRIL
jgi:hypothetical protein